MSGPSTGVAGQLLMFSARESTDPDGDTLKYIWIVANGDTLPWFSAIDQGWEYPQRGTYVPSLIVTDTHGLADTASMTVTLVNSKPAVSRVAPPAAQARGDTSRTVVSFTDADRYDTHWVVLHWGDGTSDSTQSGGGFGRDSLTHAYGRPGTYWVRATVRDEPGAIDSAAATDPVVVFDQTRHEFIAGYDAVDLGSLGGNGVMPAAINDRGQIVGFSLSSNGYPHAFLWQNGSMSDLGTLGHSASFAQTINEAGEVAGMVQDTLSLSNINSSNPNCRCTAEPTIWINGEGRTLGVASIGAWPGAVRIMANGDIAWNFGYYLTEAPFLWSNGDWKPLGSLRPGSGGGIHDVNNRDQIVGASVVGYIRLGDIRHPFLWENGVMRDLGVLASVPCADDATKDCSWGEAAAINDSGTIVGTSVANDGAAHFVMWANGTIHDLGIAGNSASIVINNRGQIAFTRNGESFFLSDGNMRALGSLGGATDILGINDAGTVLGVGRLPTGEPHVFVWSQERGMVDLGTGPDGFHAAWPVAMNAAGDIIGFTSPSTLPCARDSFGGCEGSRAVLWRNTQASR